MWYDDTPDKTATEKIHAAIAAYVARFRVNPELVLVNAIDFVEVAGWHVFRDLRVRPNNFWVGSEGNDATISAQMDSRRRQTYA
jgi:hypothetical protein